MRKYMYLTKINNEKKKNKRAKRAHRVLGRSAEEKVKGHNGANNNPRGII